MVLAPTASVVVGQLTGPTPGADTPTRLRLTVPSLVTTTVYGTRSPASTSPFPSTSVGVPAVRSSSSEPVWTSGVVVLSATETTRVPSGRAPDTVAVFVTEPASRSVWVIA